MSRSCLLAVLLAFLLPSPPASGVGAASRAALRVRLGSPDLLRFLDDRTVAVLAFEPGKLDVPGLMAGLAGQVEAGRRRQLSERGSGWLGELARAGAREV